MSGTAKCIVLGIGGGIAAFKSANLASRLVQNGHRVRVVMTPAAKQFIGAATFSALTGNAVVDDVFAPEHFPFGPHIEVIRDADLLVVAPATADLIAKFAHGIADQLLPTMWLQAACPLLIAPAMSNLMWSKPALQRNMQQLRSDGVHVVGPNSGWLSCREKGPGRMAEPETIHSAIEGLLGR